MTNYSKTASLLVFFVVLFVFIVLLLVLPKGSWTTADEVETSDEVEKELICEKMGFSSIPPVMWSSLYTRYKMNQCVFDERIIRKGYVYRYVPLEYKYERGCPGGIDNFRVKLESDNNDTLEISDVNFFTIIKVPEEWGDEGKVKTTFYFENQIYNCDIVISRMELKKWTESDRGQVVAANDTITKVSVNERGYQHVPFEVTSDKIKFYAAKEPELVLEAPENTRLVLQLFTYNMESLERNETLLETEDIQVSVYDGDSSSDSVNPILYRFWTNYAYPKETPVSSSGNFLTFIFNTTGPIAYVPDELFKTTIHVIEKPWNCLWSKLEIDKKCNWTIIDKSNNQSLLLSREIQADTPFCLIFTHDAELNATDAFFVTWETKDSISTLYRVRGIIPMRRYFGQSIRLQIPEGSNKGKIRMSLKKDWEEANVKPLGFTFINGSCYDEEKFKHIDCHFDKTMCNWKPRSNGGLEFFRDVLNLETGGMIVSPKMSAGNHCLELELSGWKARLVIYVLKGGVKTEFLKGYALAYFIGTKRIMIRNADENSRIILAGKDLLTNQDSSGTIFLKETKLLPIEQCIENNIATLNPNVEFSKTGKNGVYDVDYPITPNKTEFSFRILNIELGKWVCFRYRFDVELSTINTCLNMEIQSDDGDRLTAWTRCGEPEEFQTGCFPLVLNRNSSEEIKIKAVIETNYVTNNSSEMIWKPRGIFNTISISQPFTKVTPPTLDDALSSINWHQMTKYEGNVSWHKINSDNSPFQFEFHFALNHLAFDFATVGNKGFWSDLLYSDPFQSDNSNSALVSFIVTVFNRTNEPISVVTMDLFLFEYGQLNKPISSRSFYVNSSSNSTKIEHEFKLGKSKNNFYQVGLGVELQGKGVPLKGIDESGDEAWDYVSDLSITKVAQNVTTQNVITCNVDSDRYCGWIFEEEDYDDNLDSNSSLIKNDKKPFFDSKFKINQAFITLLNVDKNGRVQEWISAKTPAISNASNMCVKFSYYVNGDDVKGDVTLSVNVVGSNGGKSVELWSISESNGPNWFDVQMPIAHPSMKEQEFRLEFEVSKEGTLGEFFVAVDSVSYGERYDCESYDRLSDPDI